MTEKAIEVSSIRKENGYTYDEWMRYLNIYVSRKTGMGVMDFCDFPSRDCYDAEMSVDEAFRESLVEHDDILQGMQAEGLF